MCVCVCGQLGGECLCVCCVYAVCMYAACVCCVCVCVGGCMCTDILYYVYWCVCVCVCFYFTVVGVLVAV